MRRVHCPRLDPQWQRTGSQGFHRSPLELDTQENDPRTLTNIWYPHMKMLFTPVIVCRLRDVRVGWRDLVGLRGVEEPRHQGPHRSRDHGPRYRPASRSWTWTFNAEPQTTNKFLPVPYFSFFFVLTASQLRNKHSREQGPSYQR